MHHKRGKPKNARAGCLLCKPNKANGAQKTELGHRGYGKLRRAIHSAGDLRRGMTE